MENGVIQVPEAYSRILQESDVLGFGQSCDRKTGFLLKGWQPQNLEEAFRAGNRYGSVCFMDH